MPCGMLKAVLMCSALLIFGCSDPNKGESKNSHIRGIDVSHYQGEVDWKLLEENITFAYIKSTQGAHTVDKLYHQHWKAIQKTTILRGVYHYFDPSIDPKLQALHFIKTTNLDFGQLPPVIDIEAFEHQNTESVIHSLRVFLDVFEKNSTCKAVIYTSPGFWNQLDSKAFSEYQLWLADYGDKALVPEGWSAWLFWQYSSEGQLSGIESKVDLSAFAKTKSELMDLKCQKS